MWRRRMDPYASLSVFSGVSIPHDIRPAMGRFIYTHFGKPQVDAVMRVINAREPLECDGCEVLGGRNAIDEDRFVFRHRFEKRADARVVLIDQKGMVPSFNQMSHGERLHLSEVHHHAAVWRPLSLNHATLQRDFEHVAMPMQIPASALMIGNPMSRIECELARDGEHDEGQFSSGIPKCLWVWIDKRHSG